MKNLRYIWCLPIMPVGILMLIISLMLLCVGMLFERVGDFMQRRAYKLALSQFEYTRWDKFMLWYRRPIDKFIAKREAKKNEMP